MRRVRQWLVLFTLTLTATGLAGCWNEPPPRSPQPDGGRCLEQCGNDSACMNACYAHEV